MYIHKMQGARRFCLALIVWFCKHLDSCRAKSIIFHVYRKGMVFRTSLIKCAALIRQICVSDLSCICSFTFEFAKELCRIRQQYTLEVILSHDCAYDTLVVPELWTRWRGRCTCMFDFRLAQSYFWQALVVLECHNVSYIIMLISALHALQQSN